MDSVLYHQYMKKMYQSGKLVANTEKVNETCLQQDSVQSTQQR